jgi:ribonuclease III
VASNRDDLDARLGWRIAKPGLLKEALTHASALDGRERAGQRDYERLEFLGDRVLGLVVAQALFERFPDLGEAGLALQLNALVNRGACARAARRAGLGADVVLSKAEAQAGGADKDTILADVCEAVIAALYLDGGMPAARGFIHRYWAPEWEAAAAAGQDPKTALQEWAAAGAKPPPRYRVAARSGPDHAPHFIVEVSVEGAGEASGAGGSKRDAERAAARALLEQLL